MGYVPFLYLYIILVHSCQQTGFPGSKYHTYATGCGRVGVTLPRLLARFEGSLRRRKGTKGQERGEDKGREKFGKGSNDRVKR